MSGWEPDVDHCAGHLVSMILVIVTSTASTPDPAW